MKGTIKESKVKHWRYVEVAVRFVIVIMAILATHPKPISIINELSYTEIMLNSLLFIGFYFMALSVCSPMFKMVEDKYQKEVINEKRKD